LTASSPSGPCRIAAGAAQAAIPQIDRIDEQIEDLISERARVAEAVARAKQESGDTTYYRAEREAQVLRKVMERNRGPLSDEEMARLFREIMSACLALEQVMTIAFLGPEGTFTQAAALKHFGHSVQTTPLATIGDVFREVESGAASYGVVPVPMAWCRWRTPAKAWSTIPSTSSCSPRSRSVAR